MAVKKELMHMSCPVALADVMAIQSLANGAASAEQQKRALQWILNQACAQQVLPWLPDDPRGSDFFAGRVSVAHHIVKIMKADPQKYRKQE